MTLSPSPAAPPIYLVSSCLVGLNTRYDGCRKPSPACLAALAGKIFIPFCPEQLGGLPTPRPAADLVGGDGLAVLNGTARVVTKEGMDVTASFIAGAQEVLALARLQPVAGVYLKSKSPSCGLSPLMGVTAALLRQHGFSLTEF